MDNVYCRDVKFLSQVEIVIIIILMIVSVIIHNNTILFITVATKLHVAWRDLDLVDGGRELSYLLLA